MRCSIHSGLIWSKWLSDTESRWIITGLPENLNILVEEQELLLIPNNPMETCTIQFY